MEKACITCPNCGKIIEKDDTCIDCSTSVFIIEDTMKDKVKKLSEGYSVDLVRNKNFFIDRRKI